jgi:hypothetical protein
MSILQYDKIQYFDGDILPTKNMDCFFKLGINSFNTGNASPVNSGWFLAVPDTSFYDYLRQKAIWRLENKWDEVNGWNEPVPKDPVGKWSFNGASLDQGLITHCFVLNNGSVQLFDVTHASIYTANYKVNKVKLSSALSCCDGKAPVEFFIHFTGMSKPWLAKNAKSNEPNVRKWLEELDKLHLPVNSATVYSGSLKSPLGYWHPNK